MEEKSEDKSGKIASVHKLFKALGHPTRLQMVRLLLSGNECCVKSLVQYTGEEFSSVSQHLRVLREAGLEMESRRGRQNFYQLCHDEYVRQLLGVGDGLLSLERP